MAVLSKDERRIVDRVRRVAEDSRFRDDSCRAVGTIESVKPVAFEGVLGKGRLD